MKNTRRNFLLQTAMAGAALSLPNALSAKAGNTTLRTGATILFQGDSITDAGRRIGSSDWNHILGQGYAFMIAGKIGFEHPDRKYLFVNRGISGNKIPDLQARWQEDCIDIKPDLLSILVGINDIAAAIAGNASYKAKAYENEYRKLLAQTRDNLPGIPIVIGEPFALPGKRTNNQWQLYEAELQARQEMAKKLAMEFNAAYVPFHTLFLQAAQATDAETWLWDGVHPMPAGHELMANAWIKEVRHHFNLF